MWTDDDFLNAIHANYLDDAPWLIYSDWLYERGDPHWEMFRQPRLTNSIGMKFQLILPGTFLMGSPPDEKWHVDDEVQHSVALTRLFYMGVYPVTQAE